MGRREVGTAIRLTLGRGVAVEGVGVPRVAREEAESESEEGGGESSVGELIIWAAREVFFVPPSPHRPSSTSSSVVSDVEGEVVTSATE